MGEASKMSEASATQSSTFENLATVGEQQTCLF